MHLFLTGLGSYGDVLPMAGLGSAMSARGHRVSMVANPYFCDVIQGAGIEFLPLGTAEEYVELTEHPDLWHPFRGPKLVLSYGSRFIGRLYELLEGVVERDRLVLAAHGLDLASRTFHDKHKTPLATVHFAPLSLRTLADTPRFFGLMTGRWTPGWLKALQFSLGDRFVVDPCVGGELNQLRARLDLRPVRQIYREWHNSPQLVLGMWPDWFAEKQPDWPGHTELVGFPLWDPKTSAELPKEVQKFLSAGPPPIVFSPGSANAQAVDFFRTAAEVCRRRKLRAIFATKFPDQLPERLPNGVRQFAFVPFSQLLPHSRAIVHHGGIGTCAQAFAAGVPQFVMPMAYDQLDNATRVKRLGVGDFLRQKRFKPDRVEKALVRLLDSKDVATKCAELAERIAAAPRLTPACNALEQLDKNRHKSEETTEE